MQQCCVMTGIPVKMSWTILVFITLCSTTSPAATVIEQIVVDPETGIRYAVVYGDAKSKQDADAYCNATYGTRLASFYDVASIVSWETEWETSHPNLSVLYQLWVHGTQNSGFPNLNIDEGGMWYGLVDDATDAMFGPCDATLIEDCGWDGITEDECKSRGCCFGSGSPTCFHSSEYIPGFFRYPGVMLRTWGLSRSDVTLEECSNNCMTTVNCKAFFYIPKDVKNPCVHSTKGISKIHDDRTGQVYTYIRYFRMYWECGQVVLAAAGTGDFFSGSKSLFDCVYYCDTNTACISLQSTHSETAENPSCDLFSTAFATIPPTSSIHTLYDYYCRKGAAVFDMVDQPSLELTDLLHHDRTRCVSGSSLGSPHAILKLRIPWPMPYAFFPPIPTKLKLVGSESMVCDSEDFPSSIMDPNTILVYAKNRGRGSLPNHAEFAGHSKLCPATSTNIVNGQKECIFQCLCATQLCDNIFLAIPSNSIELCWAFFAL